MLPCIPKGYWNKEILNIFKTFNVYIFKGIDDATLSHISKPSKKHEIT
jgi:hypothetical protein